MPKGLAGHRDAGFVPAAIANRPTITAPERNASRARTERVNDSSGAPAAANPLNAALPVMLAVKMWPSPRNERLLIER